MGKKEELLSVINDLDAVLEEVEELRAKILDAYNEVLFKEARAKEADVSQQEEDYSTFSGAW